MIAHDQPDSTDAKALRERIEAALAKEKADGH